MRFAILKYKTFHNCFSIKSSNFEKQISSKFSFAKWFKFHKKNKQFENSVGKKGFFYVGIEVVSKSFMLSKQTAILSSNKSQEEEREHRNNYVLDASALKQDIIEADCETKVVVEKSGMIFW